MSSIEKLDGPNYRVWSLRVKRLLQSQGLWDIVEPLPKEGQVGEQALAIPGDAPTVAPAPASDFAIRDAKASCMIMDHCESVPLNLIVSIECARSQWARLRKLYGPSVEKLAGLNRALLAYTLEAGDKEFAQIAGELEALRDQIGGLSEDKRPTEMFMHMVMSDMACKKDEEYRELIDEHLRKEGRIDYEGI
ncbi:hypothetical protein O988_05680 [Pseudogymnoascus sp. VKM F-3808]|nr:hypothetical protein O988_05680 [Pseudogymnoascus sp. VKM F-3808]